MVTRYSLLTASGWYCPIVSAAGEAFETRSERVKRAIPMRNNIMVCTHHKTGTVWMQSIFKDISEKLGVEFVNYWKDKGLNSLKKGNRKKIILNYHSIFDMELLSNLDDLRMMHVVRDPRDVLISAACYHEKASEGWLHIPREEFGGKTYQEAILELKSLPEKISFEMNNSTYQTICDMVDWDYNRDDCIEVRYEDLFDDELLIIFTRVFEFLGFEAHEIAYCRSAAVKYSLFGKMSKRKNSHIRSGSTKQWKRHFSCELAREFCKRFPTALGTLGYEDDDSWIENGAISSRNIFVNGLRSMVDLRRWTR